MRKDGMKGLDLLLGILIMTGCTATKDVEVRHYIEVKDRVDQNMEAGNAGFIMGTPQPEDRSDIRKTRKIYVLEVSKPVEETEETVVMEDQPADMEEETDMPEEEDLSDESEQMLETLDLREKAVRQAGGPSSSVVEYTIQKDDTLQKISKKFYDSYSKWPRIYELNKNVISDPDRIQPGTVIQIPMD